MIKPAENCIGTIENSAVNDLCDDENSPDFRCREFVRRAVRFARPGMASGWVPALRVEPDQAQGVLADRE